MLVKLYSIEGEISCDTLSIRDNPIETIITIFHEGEILTQIKPENIEWIVDKTGCKYELMIAPIN